MFNTKEEMIIYAIPGLGADERVFKYLDLDIKPIHWIPPVKNESLEAYALRLSKQVNTDKPFVLLGVSFGGMVAVELNKYITPEKTIIISSAASKDELPRLTGFFKMAGITKILPSFLLKPPSFVAYKAFGVKNPENKRLLKTIIKDTDPQFIRWCMDKIVHWNNEDIPSHIKRIHGDKDQLLKMRSGVEYSVIKNGGHFMIVEQANQIKKIILQYLSPSI